jgi:hypothetical protein
MVSPAMPRWGPFFADAGLDGFDKFLGEFFIVKAQANIFIAWAKADKSPVSICFQA